MYLLSNFEGRFQVLCILDAPRHGRTTAAGRIIAAHVFPLHITDQPVIKCFHQIKGIEVAADIRTGGKQKDFLLRISKIEAFRVLLTYTVQSVNLCFQVGTDTPEIERR